MGYEPHLSAELQFLPAALCPAAGATGLWPLPHSQADWEPARSRPRVPQECSCAPIIHPQGCHWEGSSTKWRVGKSRSSYPSTIPLSLQSPLTQPPSLGKWSSTTDGEPQTEGHAPTLF